MSDFSAVWPAIVAIFAGVSGISAAIFHFVKTYNRGYDWVQRQNEQDREIKAMKSELKALTKAMLACLQGMHEHGFNGPVTKGIHELQEHINNRAHE